MTRKEFIAHYVAIRGKADITAIGADSLLSGARSFADLLEKSGEAPWLEDSPELTTLKAISQMLLVQADAATP